MALFYEHFNDFAKIAIWHIAEEKNFFLEKVPLERQITHPHKQLQHLAGRYLLQQLYPDFPYHLIEIADTRKPFLPKEEYHFSISHCGDYAAVIVSKDHRVGIDIELITPKVEKIKHKFLNDEELLNRVASPPSTRHLTLLWCCKEAVFKWYGIGGVDFRKDIFLQPLGMGENGPIIWCEFSKHGKVSLQIHTKFFEGLCLAWIATI